MLTIGHQHDVTFKVNVMGTSAEASARLVLGTHPELSFPAKKVGDVWHANLRIPAGMDAGTYPIRVEVVVNNRHFTPLVKQVELVKNEVVEPSAAPEELPVEVAPPVELPAVDPAPTAEEPPVETPPDEIEFTATVPQQDETQPQTDVPRISIIQMVADRERTDVKEAALQSTVEKAAMVEPPVEHISVLDVVTSAPKPTLASLQKVLEAPVVKVYTPVVTPLPKPNEVKAVPVKVKLSDVAKIAEAKAPAPKKTASPKKPKPVAELKTELPVKLIKGDIIYE